MGSDHLVRRSIESNDGGIIVNRQLLAMRFQLLAGLFGVLLAVRLIAQEEILLNDLGARMPLFNGRTLDGWSVRGGHANYKVENGMIVGTTVEGSPNSFLCKGPFTDFVLDFDVLCDKELNSGIQIRSHVYKDGERKGVVYGYQCEIADAYITNCGNFWDEARLEKWWDDFSDKPEARTAYKADQWNHYRIVAQGDHIRSWVNGIACADFHDKTDASGFIGLQVHEIKRGTGPLHVRWKNLRVRELKLGEKAERSLRGRRRENQNVLPARVEWEGRVFDWNGF